MTGTVTYRTLSVLIESDWNLKALTGPLMPTTLHSINRIRLEFKDSGYDLTAYCQPMY